MTPDEIRALRAALGLSGAAFGRKVVGEWVRPRSAATMVSRWENGHHEPERRSLAKMIELQMMAQPPGAKYGR